MLRDLVLDQSLCCQRLLLRARAGACKLFGGRTDFTAVMDRHTFPLSANRYEHLYHNLNGSHSQFTIL